MTTDLLSSIGDRMLTGKEAAYLLHISVHTLWVLRRDRRITFFRFPNGQLRYRRQDIENFLGASMRLSAEVNKGIQGIGEADIKREANK